jgi:hypothetical protein
MGGLGFALLLISLWYSVDLGRKHVEAYAQEPSSQRTNGDDQAKELINAHDFARAYQAAKHISEQELLSDISSVELLVYPDARMSP